MASTRGSVALRVGRWLLSLAVPACCVLWMLLVLEPRPPEISVGEIVGTVERWGDDTPAPAPGSEEIVDTSSRPEREEIVDKPVPPPEREVVVIDMSPPPPIRGGARSKPPEKPPPERGRIMDASPSPKREEIIDASPPPSPPERQAIIEPPPPPPPSETTAVREERQESSTAQKPDPCAGRYIYIHDLPRRFNADLLRRCRSLSEWTDMCKHVSNSGMGPRLTRTGGALPSTGWYDTNQFTLEVIFHGRMRRYGCLTRDAARAAAVYVPYYAGLDVGRHLWAPFGNAARDALAEDLARWLRASPAWAAHGGRDHFLVAGRIAWDFRREEPGGEWGSRLLLLPEARNMTALVLESSGPWQAATDVAVPYPTCFHPSRGAAEVAAWQRAVRRARRPWLFAFAGARRRPRAGTTAAQLRDAVMDQCARSRRCALLQCGGLRRDGCYAPGNVMRLFKGAAFCLQPPGDSYTRRSAFDAMLAGCVPVFFHPGSAYAQYAWHLPADHTTYSVFVPGDSVRNGSVAVEDVLRRFSRAQVAAMRERVVRLIPRIVYRDPRAGGDGGGGFRDAVDVAVDRVIDRVDRIKRGLPPREDGDDEAAHRWDVYFDRR